MKYKNTEILLEQYFPYENMTIKERNYIITFLYNTKELKDHTDMEIVSCNFKKIQDDMYNANGMIYSNISENRCFNSYIVLEENKISIKSEITRLCVKDNSIPKEFISYDTFIKGQNNTYNRQSTYSYFNDKFIDNIVINNFDIIYEQEEPKSNINSR